MYRLAIGLVWLFFIATTLFVLDVVVHSMNPEQWQELRLIVLKGDNIPIAFMLAIVSFYTGWGLLEARRNDKLIEAGKRDQVLKSMQR